MIYFLLRINYYFYNFNFVKNIKVKESNLLDIAGKEVTQLASKVSWFYFQVLLLLFFVWLKKALKYCDSLRINHHLSRFRSWERRVSEDLQDRVATTILIIIQATTMQILRTGLFPKMVQVTMLVINHSKWLSNKI